MTQELSVAIAGWERRPTFIALKEDGLPFMRQQLSDQWLRERDTKSALAPLAQAGCVLHGLRATAVVRLRRAGCTTGEICSMVGIRLRAIWSQISQVTAAVGVALKNRTWSGRS